MKASFVDLRRRSAEVIRALKRNERVTVLYRGKPAAVMHPIAQAAEDAGPPAAEHPAFGLWADRDDLTDVAEQMRRLRQGRFNAL